MSKKPWSLILSANEAYNSMTEDPVYYTTAYEIRIVKTLCAFIAANGIILLSFTLNRLQAAGLGVVHGYIMGMILSYLVFGITCKKRNRRVIIALGCGMLGFLAALEWRFETGLVLLCSLLTVAAALWCLRRDKGKADGDYAAFLEDDFDHTWFDVVIADIGHYPVWFPRDIGSGKRDRLSGRIVEVGMGLHHKYRGMEVAKIEASSGFYLCLCPLASLIPDPSMKCRGSVEIASCTGENPCTVTLYWHEYGGYTVVSGRK
jgi:multisubunit Na+/H+ antiporter MnhB subunit